MTALCALTPGLTALLQAAATQCPDKGMSSAHFIYIPASILLGIVLGYLIGGRAVRAELAVEKKKAEARAARASKTE
ncbi:MAG TPA: hypothetical protein VGQ83_17045 [Polyangia bacterium]|jgi:hypothetical protein